MLQRCEAEAVEVAAEAEQRDARLLQAALPEAMETVTQAEDAVEPGATAKSFERGGTELSEVGR